MDKDKLKNYFIIALVVLIGLLGAFGGRAVSKYRQEVAILKSNNSSLKLDNIKLDEKIWAKNDTIKKQNAEIERLMALFRAKDRQIGQLRADLDSALVWLNFITADSSYEFLQFEAYNYPGVLKYLFNEPQIKHIHSDYLVARNSEQIIPVLTSQINNCKEQFAVRDSIAYSLKQVSEWQKQQLANCEKANKNSDQIIKDTEKQRDKEKHRKNFWRFTSAVATGVAVVLAVFGL